MLTTSTKRPHQVETVRKTSANALTINMSISGVEIESTDWYDLTFAF